MGSCAMRVCCELLIVTISMCHPSLESQLDWRSREATGDPTSSRSAIVGFEYSVELPRLQQVGVGQTSDLYAQFDRPSIASAGMRSRAPPLGHQ